MRFSTLVVLLCLPILLLSCGSDVPPQEQLDPGDEVTPDVPTGEADGRVTPVAQLPNTLSLTAAGGTAEADGYRLRFTLSAPIQANAAENEAYRLNSTISIQAQ
jgi:hypothetical protein